MQVTCQTTPRSRRHFVTPCRSRHDTQDITNSGGINDFRRHSHLANYRGDDRYPLRRPYHRPRAPVPFTHRPCVRHWYWLDPRWDRRRHSWCKRLVARTAVAAVASGVISIIAGIFIFLLPGLAITTVILFSAIPLVVVSATTLLTLPFRRMSRATV